MALLKALTEGPQTNRQLADGLNLDRAGVSVVLRHMRQAGLADFERGSWPRLWFLTQTGGESGHITES